MTAADAPVPPPAACCCRSCPAAGGPAMAVPSCLMPACCCVRLLCHVRGPGAGGLCGALPQTADGPGHIPLACVATAATAVQVTCRRGGHRGVIPAMSRGRCPLAGKPRSTGTWTHRAACTTTTAPRARPRGSDPRLPGLHQAALRRHRWPPPTPPPSQDATLADQLEASLMIRYNGRVDANDTVLLP
jgi:hypothetical protein